MNSTWRKGLWGRIARIAYPGGAAAPFFSSGRILEGPILPMTFTLFGPQDGSARCVQAYLTPVSGLTVTAWVGEQTCGEAQPLEVGGVMSYLCRPTTRWGDVVLRGER